VSREERVARNESLFREVNERIKDAHEEAPAGSESEFLCECGESECTNPVSLTLREYEEVRREPTHFAILPGHEDPEIERVVAWSERFVVVEKTEPQAARIATREDPRG
jgi:hypothetical protein